jgi:hypothetical protein
VFGRNLARKLAGRVFSLEAAGRIVLEGLSSRNKYNNKALLIKTTTARKKGVDGDTLYKNPPLHKTSFQTNARREGVET